MSGPPPQGCGHNRLGESLAELVIRNVRLALPEGIVQGELAVSEGRISEISVSGIRKGEREIDAGGRIAIPGAIDVHAHLHDPKYLHRENFKNGTTAAAAGGVTSVIVMPLDTPMLTRAEIERVIKAGKRYALIDFSLHAGNMAASALKQVHAIAGLGIKSFKIFTCMPYGVDEKTLHQFMLEIKDIGGIAFVHAEDDKIIRECTKQLLEAGRKDPLAHAESRPNEAEEKAVKRVLKFTKRAGCNLHLAHLTTKQGVELVKKAKAQRLRMTTEVCPHHLLFAKEDMQTHGAYLKVNPSLKTREDCSALWDALAEGIIDIVATDHAPGTRKEKEVGWKNIWAAQIGVPGIETMLPLLLSEGVAKGKLTLERFIDALCTRPAQIFGLYPRKGVIREGSDADLVILDLKREWTIAAERLHYKVGWTPYEGFKVRGAPFLTISRGEVLAENGKVMGKPGRGQFLVG